MIRVVIADDQDLVREGLRMMLDAEPDLQVVGEARTGIEALAQTRLVDPDVVLMDIRMPDLDGIEATTRLVSSGARARVLILTTFDVDKHVFRAMRAGASGYMLKDGTREQLAAAVRTVAAGDSLLAPAITRRLIQDFCRTPPADTARAEAARALTDREIEILRSVARGLSNREIASEMYLADATVKSHIAHILAKLNLRDRVQIVVFAYESGLVRAGGPSPGG
jgi:DNA-binding NarL/FixJ family response regulator